MRLLDRVNQFCDNNRMIIHDLRTDYLIYDELDENKLMVISFNCTAFDQNPIRSENYFYAPKDRMADIKSTLVKAKAKSYADFLVSFFVMLDHP